MSISEQIQKELSETKKILEKNQDFISLEEFYAEMKKLGVAKKPEYDLPLIDTIGRNLYEINHASNKTGLMKF